MTIKPCLKASSLLPLALLLALAPFGHARVQQKREPRKLFRIGNSFIDRTGRVRISVNHVDFDLFGRKGEAGRHDLSGEDDGDSLFGRPRLLSVGDFSDGMAKFLVDTRPRSRRIFPAYGFIDETGKTVIPARQWSVEDFHEGRALVRGQKSGYIDRTGAFVIPPRYALAYPFHEGLALACVEWEKCGYIDRDGKTVVPFIYHGGTHFSEGLAHVYQKDKPVGYIDRTGRVVIHPSREFRAVGQFSEGLASVLAGNKYGYIDRAGKLVIPPQFDEAREFSEGKALVSKDGSWGFIDRAGRVAVPIKYAYASSFSEGLAAVTLSRDRAATPGWGYIDHEGRMAIPVQFDYAAPFDGGLAGVDFKPDSQSLVDSYIDREGRVVWDGRRR